MRPASQFAVAIKVIRAQLQQTLVTAAHDKAVYDHRDLEARINLFVS